MESSTLLNLCKNVLKRHLDLVDRHISQAEFKEPKVNSKKFILESALTFEKIIKCFGENLSPSDRLALNGRIANISSINTFYCYQYFFHTFDKAYNDYRYNNDTLEINLKQSIFDLLAYQLKGASGSLGNMFAQRIQNFDRCCIGLIKKNDQYYQLAIFGLINIVDSLLRRRDKTFSKIIQNDVNIIIDLILSDKMDDMPSAYAFSYAVLTDCIKVEGLIDSEKISLINNKVKKKFLDYVYSLNVSQMSFYHLLWVANSLYSVGLEDLFLKFYNQIIDQYNRKKEISYPLNILSIFSRVICMKLSRESTEKLIEFDLPFNINKVDVDEVIGRIFPGFIENAHSIKLNKNDIDFINSLDDKKIRDIIASIIIENGKIDGSAKVALEMEKKKSHASSEIADLIVPIANSEETIHVCFPIKSYREISGKSVPERYIHQIIKPFINFNKCVSILISAKPCSSSLRDYITKYKSKKDYPIFLIEEETFAKLLKLFNKIQIE